MNSGADVYIEPKLKSDRINIGVIPGCCLLQGCMKKNGTPCGKCEKYTN